MLVVFARTTASSSTAPMSSLAALVLILPAAVVLPVDLREHAIARCDP